MRVGKIPCRQGLFYRNSGLGIIILIFVRLSPGQINSLFNVNVLIKSVFNSFFEFLTF